MTTQNDDSSLGAQVARLQMLVQGLVDEIHRIAVPPDFYLALDGDGDLAIWRHRPGEQPECLGVRFMSGHAQIEPALAEWLWTVLPVREER